MNNYAKICPVKQMDIHNFKRITFKKISKVIVCFYFLHIKRQSKRKSGARLRGPTGHVLDPIHGRVTGTRLGGPPTSPCIEKMLPPCGLSLLVYSLLYYSISYSTIFEDITYSEVFLFLVLISCLTLLLKHTKLHWQII